MIVRKCCYGKYKKVEKINKTNKPLSGLLVCWLIMSLAERLSSKFHVWPRNEYSFLGQSSRTLLTDIPAARKGLFTKQWIAFNARADWPLKHRICIAIHLRAIRAESAPGNVVIFAEINELKSSFCAILSHCFSIY